jgi:hypothetical protein
MLEDNLQERRTLQYKSNENQMDIYMEEKLKKVTTSNNIPVGVGLGFCKIRTVDFMRL